MRSFIVKKIWENEGELLEIRSHTPTPPGKNISGLAELPVILTGCFGSSNGLTAQGLPVKASDMAVKAL